MKNKSQLYLSLIIINLIYACVSIFTKLASRQTPLSWQYFIFIACAFGVIGIYAILWQQVLAKTELSTAYMFKGTSLIFVLLISFFLFEEQITWNNIIGATLIISGIVLYSKS